MIRRLIFAALLASVVVPTSPRLLKNLRVARELRFCSAAIRLVRRVAVGRKEADVHDRAAIEAQARKFVQAYRPGEDWACVDESWAPPWTYYWQALFTRTG